MKEKSFISVVVYIHNREKVIAEYLDKLVLFLDEKFERYEIILVNDASEDNTLNILSSYKKKTNCVINVISLSYFQGIEKAMQAGDDYAIGDFIFEIDNVDCDYSNTALMDVYQTAMNEGYDIVSAVPNATGSLGGKLFYRLYNSSSKNNVVMEHESFRFVSRRAYNRVKQMNKTVLYRKSAYINAGLPMTTYRYEPNKANIRTFTQKEKSNRKNMAIDTLILYTDAVTNFLLLIAALFLLFAILVGAYTIGVYCFMDHKPVEGWAPIMGFLSGGLAGIFGILFIVIKYLSLILKGIYTKVDYVVEKIDKY